MALSTKAIQDHSLFSTLKGISQDLAISDCCKNIIVAKNSHVYAWDEKNASILRGKIEREVVASLDANCQSHHQSKSAIDVFRCRDPPRFVVLQLLLNIDASCAILVGKNNASLVFLPQVPFLTETSCRVAAIDERFFLSYAKVSLLQAAFHPQDNNYVLLLTSDNYLRLYAVDNPHKHITGCCLIQKQANSIHDSSFALGQRAVAFDFGDALTLNPKLSAAGSDDSITAILVWPVYVLWENGEVYLVYMNSRGLVSGVQGPLSMFPVAEDNYGSDAYAIKYLSTVPPVLVLATTNATIHHCIILMQSSEDDVSQETSLTQWNRPQISRIYEGLEIPTLYAYESVQLELILNDLGKEDTNYFQTPIYLYKDEVCPERYICYHNLGVHSITIPWLKAFENLYEECMETLPSIETVQDTSVQHLACTKPSPNSSECPVIGLACLFDSNILSVIVVLDAFYQCHAFQQSSVKISTPLLVESRDVDVSNPLHKHYTQPFDEYIKKKLMRSCHVPRLSSPKENNLSSEECLQLLTRITAVLSEEYIQKQEIVHDDITARMERLKKEKESQLKDLQKVFVERDIINDRNSELFRKLTNGIEQQKHIIERIEMILKKLHLQLPEFSSEEQTMRSELRYIEKEIEPLQESLAQAKIKINFHQQDEKVTHLISSPLVEESKSPSLPTLLLKEGDEISNLMKNVKDLSLRV